MTRQARGGLATASGLVTIVGIASGNPYWVLFGVVALIVVGLTELWWRWGGVGLEYRRVLSSTTATCGDVVDCTIEVTNRKLLPMPWVDVTDDWPAALVPERVRSRGSGWYRRWGSAAESPEAIGEAGLPPPEKPPAQPLPEKPPPQPLPRCDGRGAIGPPSPWEATRMTWLSRPIVNRSRNV